MSPLVVFSAIFGGIGDKLYPSPKVPADVPRDCYADVVEVKQHPTGWTLKPPVWEHATNPRLRARRHKLLSHVLYPDAEYTLWIDGCLTLKVDPWLLVRKYLKEHDLCVFKHMDRKCVFEEMNACLRLQKDSPEVIEKLRRRYVAEGYPTRNGLAETTAVLRRHTPQIKQFNETWWEELRSWSIRDQLSADYIAWRLNMRYATFAGTRCQSPYFEWRSHR